MEANRLTYQKLVLQIDSQGQRVRGRFNTLDGYKYITGMIVRMNTLSNDRINRATLGIKVNRDIVIPADTKLHQISRGELAGPNDAIYPLLEEANQSVIELDYQDIDEALYSGFPYQLHVYLKLQNSLVKNSLDFIAQTSDIMIQTESFEINNQGEEQILNFQTMANYSHVRGIMIYPDGFSIIKNFPVAEIKINGNTILQPDTLLNWAISSVHYTPANTQQRFLEVFEEAGSSPVHIKYKDNTQYSFSAYKVKVCLLLQK